MCTWVITVKSVESQDCWTGVILAVVYELVVSSLAAAAFAYVRVLVRGGWIPNINISPYSKKCFLKVGIYKAFLHAAANFIIRQN